MKHGDSTIDPEAATRSSSYKGKVPIVVQPALARSGAANKGLAIFDFVLRISAMVAALAAAAAMGTSNETLPFFTRFFQFQANYNDIQTFEFFMIAMSMVAGYLLLSLPLAIVCIVRPRAAGPRILLVILDTMMLTLATAAGAAATAIVYLAHNGNSSTNWFPICQQFGDFCQKVSGAVVASMLTVAMMMMMVLLSGASLRRL